MAKMQVILRKNNLVSEHSNSQNNSGNMKTMIESLQQSIQQKEDTIKSLLLQITRLQSTQKIERGAVI